MATIFDKIVSGEIPAFKICENDQFLAFLDAFPLVEGHVLVIPKKATNYLFTESNDILREILLFAKPIALAMDKSFDCERVGVSVVGLEVPHSHIHLIPINGVGDMDFNKKKLQIDAERMFEIAEMIKTNL